MSETKCCQHYDINQADREEKAMNRPANSSHICRSKSNTMLTNEAISTYAPSQCQSHCNRYFDLLESTMPLMSLFVNYMRM